MAGRVLLYACVFFRIERWNVPLGIPDSVFIVTDTVLMEFAGESEFGRASSLSSVRNCCSRGYRGPGLELLLAVF